MAVLTDHHWSWGQGDLLPVIQETLYDDTDTVINLTGATVKFLLWNKETKAVKINAAAVVVSAAGGVVQYVPTGTDTDTAGEFRRQWKVTYTAGTKPLTVPNDQRGERGYPVTISPKIA